MDTSGFYSIRHLKAAAIHTGINYNTLRADISFFVANSLLQKHGAKLRLKSLPRPIQKLIKFYSPDISATGFCNLIKKSIFFNHLYKQAVKESKKIFDRTIRKKYLTTVKDSNTFLGVNQSLFCSLSTVASYYDKSKTTALRYVRDLKKSGLIKVKRNCQQIAHVSQLPFLRNDRFINRIFVNGEFVFERLPNSYKF